MVRACAAKRRQCVKKWSMKWRVPGQEADQKKLGERLCKVSQACKLNREDAMDHSRFEPAPLIRATARPCAHYKCMYVCMYVCM